VRLSTILSEVARNLATGTTRAVGLALALGVAAGALATLDASTIVGMEHDAARYRSAAADVRTVSAPGLVDPQACDALGGSTSVQDAGALVPTTPVVPSATPASPLQSFAVTPSLAGVLAVRSPLPEGVWMSDQLAERLGLARGATLETHDGPLVLAGTFAWPDDGRDGRLGFAVLRPTVTNARFEECWAAAWPTTPAVEDLLRGVVDVQPQSTEAITVGQVNRSLGAAYDAHATYVARPTRYTVAACAVLGLVLGYASVRRRRLEHAGALHAGQSRSAQLATSSLETVVWAAVGTAVSVVGLRVVVARVGAMDPTAVFDVVVRGPVLGALCAVVGATVAACLVREQHLFRYFKDR
jgi:hypothetical protein